MPEESKVMRTSIVAVGEDVDVDLDPDWVLLREGAKAEERREEILEEDQVVVMESGKSLVGISLGDAWKD